MRISSTNIGMESARSYSSFTSKKTSALLLAGKRMPEKDIEDKKNTLQERLNGRSLGKRVGEFSYRLNNRDSLSTVREKCMNYLMRIFFGDTKRFDYEDILIEAASGRNLSNQPVSEALYYHQETYFQESEYTSFSTKGTVKCEDGREIYMNLNVEMSRSFSAYYESHYTQIQTRMCDPLVINFNGNTAELSDQTFFFDINADGEQDEISMLGSGSGYLALDKNGDGIINDGNELFGAKSGNGFSDLAAYDSDGNGWIDENDAIWDKLFIWTKDEKGTDKCYKLSEKGVGAICLSSAATDFSLNSPDNQVNGRIRRTGFFLYENGNAGTLQHVDLAKKQEAARLYEEAEPFLQAGQFDFAR